MKIGFIKFLKSKDFFEIMEEYGNHKFPIKAKNWNQDGWQDYSKDYVFTMLKLWTWENEAGKESDFLEIF